MNSGKQFEADFKASVPNNAYYYRLRDGTSSWDKGENTRFQMTNDYDNLIFYNGTLYLLELKNTKGKSIPFTNFKDKQFEGLLKGS